MDDLCDPTAVPTAIWPGPDDEDTIVDVAPAGALVRRRTFPAIDPAYLEDVSSDVAFVLVGEVIRG